MINTLPGIVANLRRRSALLFFAGLPALLAAACTPIPPYVPEPSQTPFAQGRIWQIEGSGLETSHIFATHERNDKRLLVLPGPAEAAFAQSEILALESLADPYIQAELYTKENLELTGEEDLADLIGARSYGILSWHLKQRQLAPNVNAKPWVAWTYLGGENFGFVNYGSYLDDLSDKTQARWLEDRGVELGKRVVGLQTDQERFDIYDKMPLKQQADMLKLRLDRYSELAPRVPKVQLYLDGDMARLYALWLEYLSWLPPDTAQILDDYRINNRNRVMVERMLPLMQEKQTFVAVDSLHLLGEEGILRLLEQRGFTVTPLL